MEQISTNSFELIQYLQEQHEMKEQFLETLKNLFNGRTANRKLMEALDWERDFYNKIKIELIKDGVIKSGRGRGGTVIVTKDATLVKEDN